MPNLIDFHAHILPGADHGSRSRDTSVKQFELIKNTGADTVIATPHFYPSNTKVEDFLKRREFCSEKLLDSEAPKMGVRVITGAEVLVCEGMERMTDLEKLCIPGTNTLLLELPVTEWTEGLLETVERISERHTVVLAHIDRYPLSDVLQFLDFKSVFAQMNPGELTKLFLNKKYLELIDKGWVAALGSDLHSTNEKQTATFKKAVKKLGNERIEKIMTRSAELIKDAKYLI